jgi:hypothetical protein
MVVPQYRPHLQIPPHSSLKIILVFDTTELWLFILSPAMYQGTVKPLVIGCDIKITGQACSTRWQQSAALVERLLAAKMKVIKLKPAPLSLRPPQISHGQKWDSQSWYSGFLCHLDMEIDVILKDRCSMLLQTISMYLQVHMVLQSRMQSSPALWEP